MSASLVGSEMCIRDRLSPPRAPSAPRRTGGLQPPSTAPTHGLRHGGKPCLLYTSDAADDM
eukprot:15406631-Alexandrium_andersonii.AAC.1